MYNSFSEVKKALSAGKTVVEIVEHYLTQIDSQKELNAFLEVFGTTALAQAKLVDEKISNGTGGKLAGMVIAIKDNICYAEHSVSCSSKILTPFESIYSATVIERLLAEDAVIIGRTNCDEFAMGSSNENSAFGPVKNNLRPTHVPGGSSGGSAVAVSAGMCTASLGSDTGGSIRQPASFTGTVGFKPTYGRISRYGLIAYASSFDQIGPFTNTVEDSALLLEIMAGKDLQDSTSSSLPTEQYSETKNTQKLRIGILSEAIDNESVDVEIREKLKSLSDTLIAQGHTVGKVSFPYLEYLVPTYYVLTTAEASSNLSRFDGVHFGHRSTEAKGVEDTYTRSRTEGFGAEVKRRIMAGTFVLSNEHYDAYYTKAQKVRRVLKNKTDDIFKEYDILLSPTTPTTAFERGAVNDPIQMYLQDIFTVHANLTGNPAISLPIGNHTNGLPFGIQLMTADFQEQLLFDVAQQLEKLNLN